MTPVFPVATRHNADARVVYFSIIGIGGEFKTAPALPD
jgi:hypothetical protein